MNLIYSKPEIKSNSSKPNAFSNFGFPYNLLDDRRFEELLYSIHKNEIEFGKLHPILRTTFNHFSNP